MAIPAVNASSANNSAAPLDDVMLAMDVVDTLRHREQLVERELSADDADDGLLKRLRTIYDAQGIKVSDQVLREGVKALQEERFAYVPPPPGFKRGLALIYVRRGKYAKYMAIAAVVIVMLFGGYYFGYQLPQQWRQAETARQFDQVLPAKVDDGLTRIKSLTSDAQIIASAQTMATSARGAIAVKDLSGAQSTIDRLDKLAQNLALSYTIKIVSRSGVSSGLWRDYDGSASARKYYLIVEAFDDNGRVLSLAITNAETGKTEQVKLWGVEVSKQVFDQIRADKQDDGIIDNNVIAVKSRGKLNLDYNIAVEGGEITSW